MMLKGYSIIELTCQQRFIVKLRQGNSMRAWFKLNTATPSCDFEMTRPASLPMCVCVCVPA